jgi:hypothetical protein
MDVDQQPTDTDTHAHKGVVARPHGQRERSVGMYDCDAGS